MAEAAVEIAFGSAAIGRDAAADGGTADVKRTTVRTSPAAARTQVETTDMKIRCLGIRALRRRAVPGHGGGCLTAVESRDD
jgi:hypothetical protein